MNSHRDFYFLVTPVLCVQEGNSKASETYHKVFPLFQKRNSDLSLCIHSKALKLKQLKIITQLVRDRQ